MKKLYLAYGSNMNLEQMAYRCPTARLQGSATLEGFKLTFRGPHGGAVANIEADPAGNVPVLLWEIQAADEAALDRYEGFPILYRKQTVSVEFNGQCRKVMAYVMTPGRRIGVPSTYYFNIIRDGYRSAGFKSDTLTFAAYGSTVVE
ncbi:gamma-glutamylcyclotransferase family protein [Anaeroselena agilis]|uniref:Gamma-glutamylcyclotransferase family protein n=1 Tax=Anaeroselena agilis TaxID=3063788 RepID=A0ABU3NTE6_9FIRM|nr:gamma-glutamylcyclotransferase family protein [Selenomonadales bacterium 4137-cl]